MLIEKEKDIKSFEFLKDQNSILYNFLMKHGSLFGSREMRARKNLPVAPGTDYDFIVKEKLPWAVSGIVITTFDDSGISFLTSEKKQTVSTKNYKKMDPRITEFGQISFDNNIKIQMSYRSDFYTFREFWKDLPYEYWEKFLWKSNKDNFLNLKTEKRRDFIHEMILELYNMWLVNYPKEPSP